MDEGKLNRRQFLKGAGAAFGALTVSQGAGAAEDQNSREKYAPTKEDIRISNEMKMGINKIKIYEGELTGLMTRFSTMLEELSKVFLPNSEQERTRKKELVAEEMNIRDREKQLRGALETELADVQEFNLPEESKSYLAGEYRRLVKKLDGIRGMYQLLNTMH